MLDEEELTEAKAAFHRWAEHNPHWTDPELAFLAGYQIGAEPVEHPGISIDPQDRLTRLCDIAAKAISRNKLGGKGVKLVLMLQDGKEGGIEISGYHDSAEGIVDLIGHTFQLMRAHNLDPDEIWRVATKTFRSVTQGTSVNAPAAFRRRIGNGSV